MRILVLGGTVFLGRHVVNAAATAGHAVTIFTRGQTNPGLFPDVEHLVGNRDGDLSALRGRQWDAVVDTSGYVPRVVRQSTQLLLDQAHRYIFISTIAAYADFSHPITESSPLAELTDASSEKVEAGYGPLKAACERVVAETFGERGTCVRAGLIVGPHDLTDRFTYWPRRIAEGGDVLAPGHPQAPIQFIDVRDLAEWIMRLAENGHSGPINATGPSDPLTVQTLLQSIIDLLAVSARLVWVDDERLLREQVQPWTELPLWLPGSISSYLMRADIRLAQTHDLTFRTLKETVRDTLEWSRYVGEQRPTLTRKREHELLAGHVS